MFMQSGKNFKLSILVYVTTDVSGTVVIIFNVKRDWNTTACVKRFSAGVGVIFLSEQNICTSPPPLFSALKDLLRISWPRFSRLTPQSFCTSQLVFIPTPQS